MAATVVGVMPEAAAPNLSLRPFWGRILVLPSSVDEHERASGLIVPNEYEGDDHVRRGVVTHVDRWRAEPISSPEDLVPGTVVYYRGGVRVLDAIVLERNEILAYEAAE
jgi:hypothetical protein